MAGAPIVIPPVFRIVSTDGTAGPEGSSPSSARELSIALGPGPGFGTGAHETTQLCLQAIHAFYPRGRAWRLLDFGSGSGILSIAGAKLGASVHAVEIDELAIEHARRNALVNQVGDRIAFSRTLESASGPFDLVMANILLGVLMQAAEGLVERRAADGTLVLSGLVARDVPEASARYAALFGGERPEVFARGDWRALVWRRKW